MKCPKCGKELQKGAKFCQTCGNRIEEPSDSHENNPKKKRKYLIPLTALVLVIAIGAVVLVCSGMFKKEETEIEKVQQGFEDYFDLENHVSEVISSYKNAEGYIEKDSLNDSISAVGNYAKELYDSKEIKDYEVTEGESVWIQFNSGVEYIYIPSVEGMDSSTVSTYQPCLAMYHSELQKLGVDCVDGAANCVENVLNEYRFKHNYDNDAISLDVLKNMGENEIVIWHGHGGYNRKTHSVLQTGLKLDEARFLLDPVYYIQNMGYTDDYLTGRILCTSSGYACVTYKFFDKYLPNMNSDIVYLGACSSGKDDVLANTFINKGAKTVIANTEIIPTVYNLNMISAVFSELTIPLDNKYQDVQTALARAKDTNADIYERTECIADVRIWGEKGTRLSEEEITAENGTEGSIEGPLPESEDVRAVVGNGNYSVGCDGGTYYWKYSSSNIDPVYTLVFEDKNGDIKQLYDGTSRSEIYSLHDMLVVNQKTVDPWSQMAVVMTDSGEVVESIQNFQVVGLDNANGHFILFNDRSSGSYAPGYYNYNVRDHQLEPAVWSDQGSSFLDSDDGIVYFYKNTDDNTGVVIYSYDAKRGETQKLSTSYIEYLDSLPGYGSSPCTVYHFQATEKALYYSYGYRAGSGNFIQDAKISMYDRLSGETIDLPDIFSSSDFGNSLGYEFYVYTEDHVEKVLYYSPENNANMIVSNKGKDIELTDKPVGMLGKAFTEGDGVGNPYWIYPDDSGEPVEILPSAQIDTNAEADYVYIENVIYTGTYAFYDVDYHKENPNPNSWRDFTITDRLETYKYNIKTGERTLVCAMQYSYD